VAVKHVMRIDPIKCTGEGLCAALFPELVRLDDWGYPIIERRPIAPHEMAHARRAVAACPALALSLTKERVTRRTD
jgi:ferredoxin